MLRQVLRIGLGSGLSNRGLRTRRGGFTLGKAEGSRDYTIQSGSGVPITSTYVTFKV